MGRTKDLYLPVSTCPPLRMFLLILVFIVQQCTVLSQGTEGYFNGTSYASLYSTLNLYGRTSLSFRTCSFGQLLHQNVEGTNFLELSLLRTGELQFRWQVNGHDTRVKFGENLINNHWHDVDIMYRLGSVTVSVDSNEVLVANGTYQSDLFDLKPENSRPALMVGQGFVGCILQGAGVVLNTTFIESSGVSWGACPLPARRDCAGYGVDHCFNQPCHKFSKCVSLSDGYQCLCTMRYSGKDCDIDLGPLCNRPQYNQCLNGGSCQEDPTGNETRCVCLPKFTGTNCETFIDNTFCDNQPCRNGGTCNINQLQNNYVCTCPQGFAGTDCELNIDECQSSPCQNNGSCTDEINSYTCDCLNTGYRGPNCEININECVESNPCYTGSRCFDRYGDYICDCPPGFGGKNCDQEVNECESNPCRNGGTCDNNLNGYLCHCVAGFAGKVCEINIDECATSPCPNNTHCVDGINTFSCVCNPGYTGAVPHCVEINECASSPCLNNATCSDELNNFACHCMLGFTGRFCEVDINECLSNPCKNGSRCVDGFGKYTCECRPGYTGVNCDVDVDDCNPNPCQNSHGCRDLVDGYVCDCIAGWEGKNCDVNINECSPNPCLHGTCVDQLNSYTCACSEGYSGRLCENDINECESSPCFNGGTCADMVANFSCTCKSEFMGRTCSELYDACSFKPCENNGVCQTNKPSHQYSCTCPLGFEGSRCEMDINECIGVVCPSGQHCFDLQNRYECRCPIGFAGENCAINIDECSSNPCVNGTCIDGIGNFTCQCPVGLTGSYCEDDIDECLSDPCVNGICKNFVGSFLCYCRPGFTGIRCDIEFNECLSAPCKNNAACNDLINDYSCSCLPGFSGRNCETNINECDSDPCLNGGTCSDEVNRYVCTCVPGFTGLNCEANIDECASSPCSNGGMCIDQINRFFCNCTDSGFSGTHCETNIDDCSPSPCDNDAYCEDRIKDYTCHCYNGYEGKNCEIDIPECASSPCLNSGLCLENSNKTLYEMNYLGFYPSFAYATAGGYRCVCSSGFTGSNCETNIDDCENHQCSLNGRCVDGINDYYCECSPGYEGVYCAQEINECLKFQPCQNGATCTDLIADYSCQCSEKYGDKNCGTLLTGCDFAECQNNATCSPHLSPEGQHSYTCLCLSGFYGDHCEKLTTVSFQGNGSWTLNPNPQSFSFNSYSLDLNFRTTLPNGVIAQGFIPHPLFEYMLYLWNGHVYLNVYNNSGLVAEISSANRQNDSFWKKVILKFETSFVSLNVSGIVEQKQMSPITSPINFNTVVGSSSPYGSLSKPLLDRNVPNFIGCIQDVFFNGRIAVPDMQSFLYDVILGCPREDQCLTSSCVHGLCNDNWISYECICSRPYFGKHCEISHIPATFGYKDMQSSAELRIPDNRQASLSSSVEVSFMLRTRNAEGLVFYLGTSTVDHVLYADGQMSHNSFIVAQLVGGKIQILLKTDYDQSVEVILDKRLDDGNYHFIQISKDTQRLQVKANDTSASQPVSSSSLLQPQVLYIAGFPRTSRGKRQINLPGNTLISYTFENLTNFKGIIQDFRINNEIVVFYPLPNITANDELAPKELGLAVIHNAREGVFSDNICESHPCFHSAPCYDTWNAYICDCPKGYRGKNCEEEEPCNNNMCPEKSECKNLLVGYECIAPASFNGKNDFIEYRVQNINQSITNITFSFRSKSTGTILYWETYSPSFSKYYLHIELTNNSLEVKWDFGNPDGTALQRNFGHKIENDGNWQTVQIVIQENHRVQLTINDKLTTQSEDNHLRPFSEVFDTGSSIYLGYAVEGSAMFKGCLNEVRLGGILLPHFNSTLLPYASDTFSIERINAEIGCRLCWNEDCIHGLCEDVSTSYACQCEGGYKGPYCSIDMCINEKPCRNEGVCYHMDQKILCNCTERFTGPFCDVPNKCMSSPCQNGGICTPDLEEDYNCTCSEEFEGKNCEKRKIVDCSSSPCLHGVCTNTNNYLTIKYECQCYEGYEGRDCDYAQNLCQNDPCGGNGQCVVLQLPEYARYKCNCNPGFTGHNCETNIDDCEGSPCVNGDCIDLVGSYSCVCYPGYRGSTCQEKHKRCAKAICFNGTCVDNTSGYECICNDGFFGKHCSVFNECNSQKCNERGTCHPLHDHTERVFEFNCSCKDGYAGYSCTERLSISGDEDDTKLVLMILIPVMSLFILCLLIGAIVFLRIAKKKRATRGTYSPSRQEMFGSRVEMNHVMKPPPEERLI